MSTRQHPKKPPRGDWHPADIKAALEKAGWSLRRLSLHHGYKSATTLKEALHRPYPKAQRLIAEAIGVDPANIWPSRYPQDTTTGGAQSLEKRKHQKAA
jgi:Ner family transcriptional regulator